MNFKEEMFLTRSLSEKKSWTIITFLSILLVLLYVYSGFFGVGKFGKNFFGYPDLNRDFSGYTKQSEESW